MADLPASIIAVVFEIPLSGTPQKISVPIVNVPYTFTFLYRDTDMGGWFVDIADSSGNNMVCGMPLVTGANLLGQFAYLGINVFIVVSTDGDFLAPPTFDNLGTLSHVWVGVRIG